MPNAISSEEDDFGIYAVISSTLCKEFQEPGTGVTNSAPALKELMLDYQSLK